MSPYLAWAETMGFTRHDLPALLDIDMDTVDYLINNPETSPPPDNIRRFCLKLGVHPAYLHECLTEGDIRQNGFTIYSSSVMRVLADIATQEKTTEVDRAQAFRALDSQRHRFAYFEERHPHGAAHFRAAHAHLQSAMSSGDDIETALELYERHLANAFLERQRELIPGFRDMEAGKASALELAEIMYGEDVAETRLEEIIQQYQWVFPSRYAIIEFGFNEGGDLIIAHQNGKDFWSFKIPDLHPNFELHASYILGASRDEVIAQFIDRSLEYLHQGYECHRQSKGRWTAPRLQQAENDLVSFREWMREPWISQYAQLFENYLIAESSLIPKKDKAKACVDQGVIGQIAQNEFK